MQTDIIDRPQSAQQLGIIGMRQSRQSPVSVRVIVKTLR